MSKERIVFQTNSPIDHAFYVKGTLEDWQTYVGVPCVGNSRLELAVSAAFVGPLLYPTQSESAGLHFRGASSTGKTTALRVGGSVWGGGGQHGFIRSWRATANGLEGVAAVHNDSFLVLDEISQVSPREAGQVAYMLANGLGKQRSRRDGSTRPAATWRTFFLSSGEIALADKISEDGRQRATAGQDVRVIDVAADAGAGFGLFEDLHGCDAPHEFAERLRSATAEFHGVASRAYLRKLVNDRDRMVVKVNQFRKTWREQNCQAYESNGQIMRVAGHFGLIAAAGELAIAMGVLPWDEGAADEAAAICFQAWLEARGGTGPSEVEAGIRQIRKFFELHGESRFTPLDRPERVDQAGLPIEDRPTLNRAGFRRDTGAGIEYFVLPEAFRQELCAGFDTSAMAKVLLERGYLKGRGDGRRTSDHLKVAGSVITVYHFLPAILGEAEDEEVSNPSNPISGDEGVPF